MYNNKVLICGVDTSKLPLLKEKEKEEEIDVVNNKSDIALAKEESAKVFKENGKRVETERHFGNRRSARPL